jgi:hypothetical protein
MPRAALAYAQAATAVDFLIERHGPDAPARLVEPLEIYGDLLAEAYVYARDNDGWLALVDREVRTDSIALPIRQFSGTRTFILRRCLACHPMVS